jgi:hypothetical protein
MEIVNEVYTYVHDAHSEHYLEWMYNASSIRYRTNTRGADTTTPDYRTNTRGADTTTPDYRTNTRGADTTSTTHEKPTDCGHRLAK